MRFWFRLYTGSLYVLVAGGIIILASVFQLFSLVITEEGSLISLGLGIAFSYLAVSILKTVIPFQETFAQTQFDDGRHDVEPDWPWNLVVFILLCTSLVGAGMVAFKMSSSITDYAIHSSYQATISGKDELKLIISLLLNLMYAGAVVTFISATVSGWYLTYQLRKGLRYWLRRWQSYIRFAIANKTFGMTKTFHEWLGNCCVQCYSTEFSVVSKKDDESHIMVCSNCGLKQKNPIVEQKPIEQSAFLQTQ